MVAGEWVARTRDVLRIRSIAGLELCELRRSPNLQLAPHRHRHATISLVLDGTGCEAIGGVEYSCQWPTVLFRPAGVRHEKRYGPQGARTFVIGLPSSLDVATSLPDRPLAAEGLLTVLVYHCYRALAGDD